MALLFAGPVIAQPAAPPAPSPPAPSPPAQSPPAPSPAPIPIPAPAAIQPGWVQRGAAELQLLDKVNARTAILTVTVGQTARYGALTIGVQACAARPPDQAPDAAAFLTITDTRPGGSGFRGWMFAANPTVAILEHPIYDLRVLNCR